MRTPKPAVLLLLRRPGEDEPSSYSVSRDGGAPVKVSDAQKKNAPPASGRWDAAHKRVLFVDRGNVVFIDAAEKLPSLELQDRQTAADLMLSPNDTHVFLLVPERPAGARNVVVPNWVNETGYVEDIPGRTAVGDAQTRLLLAVLNLTTGKSVWADASFAPPVDEPKPAAAPGPGEPADSKAQTAEREVRWSMPEVSDDGKRRATSWADEYKRILKLFEDNLRLKRA